MKIDLRIVGCFLEYERKILLLYRPSHKSNGGTWGPPGGKIEAGESDEDAVIRELFEETGYIAKLSELESLGTFECTSPANVTNDWIVYRVLLSGQHEVKLSDGEHTEYKWVTPRECVAMPDLIYGVKEVLEQLNYLEK